MQRQLTPFELVRLIFSFLAAIIIYQVSAAKGIALSGDSQNSLGLIIYLFLALFAPAFLAVFLSTLVPSSRYRMIAATLNMCGVILWHLLNSFVLSLALWPLIGDLIRLSAVMTGALLAALAWKEMRARWAKKTPVAAIPLQPATKIPATSPVLLGISLISIPLTYITIFISAFLVLGYSALIFLIISEMESVPTVIIIAAFLAPIVAGWVSLRALFAQFFAKPSFQPAQTIDWSQRPLLKQMIEEVCDKVNTRKPDNVILHIKPTFFVTQHKMKTFDTIIKGRTLAIGMPLLPLLTHQELAAVLAHEFAHFAGRDTLYSVWVSPVYRTLGESIVRLQKTIAVSRHWAQTLMNYLLIPSLLFLIIFYEFFASIEAIISRSRELRADWIAASHFGSESFIGALKKIVQYGAFFTEQQSQFSLGGGSEFEKHYRLVDSVDPQELQGYLDEAMSVQQGEFDSHPTLPTRIGNLPITATAADHPNEDLQAELDEDRAVLSAAYTRLMVEVQAAFNAYQQRVPG